MSLVFTAILHFPSRMTPIRRFLITCTTFSVTLVVVAKAIAVRGTRLFAVEALLRHYERNDVKSGVGVEGLKRC